MLKREPISPGSEQVFYPEDDPVWEGSVTLPLYLSPDQFNGLWLTMMKQDEPGNKDMHHLLQSWETRAPLVERFDIVRKADLILGVTQTPEGAPVAADIDIIKFVIGATNDLLAKAFSRPNWLGRSEDT